MATIEITWVPLGMLESPYREQRLAMLAAEGEIIPEPASATITLDAEDTGLDETGLDDLRICELAFENTNLYSGPLWDLISPVIPQNRWHTSLSVGDFVSIDGRKYECKDIGWERVA
jgi:hypothetical protein